MKKLERRGLHEVIFGNPSSGCAGHGICKVVPPGIMDATTCRCCRKALAYIHFSEGGSHLTFHFLKGSFNRPLALYPFQGKEHFIQEGRLFCPDGLFGLDPAASCYLLPGKYTIMEDSHFYKIQIVVEVELAGRSGSSPFWKNNMPLLFPNLTIS